MHTHTKGEKKSAKALREGSEEDAREGGEIRKQAHFENRGEPALQGTLEMRHS